VGVIAVLVGVGGYVVHFLLGDAVSARLALPPVLPSAALDVLLVWPVFALCRAVVGTGANESPAREVEIVV
jgi:hypothetical protein